MHLRITMIFILMICMIITIIAVLPTEMESLIDKNVDPCNDFYQYACGNWIKKTPQPTLDIELKRSYDMVEKKNTEMLVQIAQEVPELRNFWDSCMDMNTINELGSKPLQYDLKRIINAQTKQDLFALVGEFSRTGTQAFAQVSVLPRKNIFTLSIDPAYRNLPISKHSDNSQYINKLIKMSGYSDKTKDWAHIYTLFNVKLDDLSESEVKRRTISSAIKRWPITFGSFWNGIGIHQKGLNAYISEAYFNRLEKWIKSIPLDQIKTYVAIVMIDRRVHWLGDAYYNAWYKFSGKDEKDLNAIYPLKEQPNRKTFCKDNVLKYFGDLIGKHFNDKTFNADSKSNVLTMIKLIQDTMKDHFIHSHWLEKKEKEKGIKKLKHMKSLVGITDISPFYPTFLIRNRYYANMDKILSHHFDRMVTKIGKRVEHDWKEFSIEPTARYIPDSNTLEFPVSILQPPFYNGPNVHPARNFGAIGFLIGHELSHGFDSQATKITSSKSFWNKKTLQMYEQNGLCLTNHSIMIYKHYLDIINRHQLVYGIYEKHHENMADNVGISIAWDAYRKYMTRVQPTIDAVTRSEGDRMFFLALGQTLCSRSSDAKLHDQLIEGNVSPSPERVNGLVMNNENFAKAFYCKTNSPMNPLEKCKIW